MFQVLVAEADDRWFETIRTYLPPESYRLERVAGPQECLDRLRRNPTDLVLVSFDFPEGGAGAMLHRILAEALELPLVVLGRPGQEAACRQFVLEGGADFLIRLPGNWELLDPILRRVITRHLLPRQLADSEQKYRTLFHQSQSGLLLLDGEGVVLDANRAAEEIFGIRRERMFNRPVLELFRAGTEFHRLFEAGIPKTEVGPQTIAFARGEEKLWLEISLSPVEAGFHRHYLLHVREVTQARQAEAELAAAVAHYRDIFENLGVMIAVLDEEGWILEVNRWVIAWAGIPRELIEGTNLFQQLQAQGLGDWLEQRLREIRSEGVTRAELEAEFFGRKAVLGLYATAVLEGERLIGYRLVYRDITRRVELEREQEELRFELLEKNRLAAMGNLLQGVAHNLNNPLTIIQSTLEWIRTTPAEEVNLAGELEVVAQQASRIREIVTNIQDKGRREALRKVVRLDLNAVLQEELKFLQANPFFKHEVKLETQLLPLPPILGIYSDFSQSFANLLNNALDAMYESELKKLKISTACRQRDIIIEFQDSGQGIPAEVLPHIFDPFFSTKPNLSVDGRPAGTGLGLHSCRMLLDPYGVKFQVESQPGQGATFRLRLPIQPARPVRTLLVEDETALRLGMTRGLRGFNVIVTAVESGEAALEQSEDFDVYVVDAGLPGMSGFDYLGILRSQRPEAKVILLTGAAPSQVEARARALNLNLILYKPVTLRELSQAIALLETPGSPVAAGW